jgi:hypothetical protein
MKVGDFVVERLHPLAPIYGYLHYLWTEKVAGSSHQIVYVPSDGGLPVLEAGRLHAPTAQ